MNDDARLERLFADALAQAAPPRAPQRLRTDITTSVSHTRQRPRWLALLKETPMHLGSTMAVGSPAARLASPPVRRAALSVLLIVLTIAAIGATIVIGSRLLRGHDPFNSGIIVPTLALDQRWDDATIPGLDQPSGMDVGPDGNLYVVNAGADEILVLSPSGDVVRRWGSTGSGEGQFIFHGDTEDPFHSFGGIAVTADGSVFVMDTENDRVQEFDARGRFIRQWGGYGSGDGQFILAWDIADAPDGTLVIGDNGRGDLRRFAQDGTYLATIASLGSAPGSLSEDTGGITVDAQGGIHAADGIGARILSWASDGHYVGETGHGGSGDAALRYPYDVAVDAAGNIYASDLARIVAYRPDGVMASQWAIPDPFNPNDALNTIAIGPDGTIFVNPWHRNIILRLKTVEQELAADVSPAATATPEATSVPSPTPVPSSIPSGLTADAPFQVPFTADQPAGWKVSRVSTGGVEMSRPVVGSAPAVHAAVRVFVPTNAYSDPCHPASGPLDPPLGSTVDDLVTSLTHLPGVRVSVPVSDITLDGFDGKAFDLEVMETNADCPDHGVWFPMWTYDNNGTEAFAGPGNNFHQHIVVLDVHGTRVLIESWTFNDTSYLDILDTQRVFDSIHFR